MIAYKITGPFTMLFLFFFNLNAQGELGVGKVTFDCNEVALDDSGMYFYIPTQFHFFHDSVVMLNPIDSMESQVYRYNTTGIPIDSLKTNGKGLFRMMADVSFSIEKTSELRHGKIEMEIQNGIGILTLHLATKKLWFKVIRKRE